MKEPRYLFVDMDEKVPLSDGFQTVEEFTTDFEDLYAEHRENRIVALDESGEAHEVEVTTSTKMEVI